MKKIRLLTIIILMIVVLATECLSRCTDSDGGKIYNTKGTVSSLSTTKTDSCTYCTGACLSIRCPEATCGGVVEYYCNIGLIKSETYICPNGCKDGACMAKTCVQENEFCGGIAGIQCCTGFKCLLVGTYPDAGGRCVQTGLTCADSDNGQDHYVKGAVSYRSSTFTDSCTSCLSTCLSIGCPEPKCTKVTEHYCEGGVHKSIEYECPRATTEGCKDGACAKFQCEDTDGGKDYYIKGTAKGRNQALKYVELADTCGNPESGGITDDPNYVIENYCFDDIVNGEDRLSLPVTYKCPNGCRDGACIQPTCVQENEFCGGITGILCCEGMTCQLEGTYADASGKCVKEEAITSIVTLAEMKDALIKSIKDYFVNQPSTLTVPEIKDLIVTYLTAPGDTVDLSGTGQFSGEKLIDIYNKAKSIPDIPSPA